MGAITYRDGIAILQLVIFPVVLVASVFIWSRTGFRAGSKIWRYAFTLSLLRIAGSISTLLTINHDSHKVEVAVAVCELIGIAPLVLTYVGILRQIDIDEKLPPRWLRLLALAGIIGLILGIAGISSSNSSSTDHSTSSMVRAGMAIFIVVYVLAILVSIKLYLQLSGSLLAFQKKLFLATALSFPFVAARLVYSALGDFTTNTHFSIIYGYTNTDMTIYLCMDVLEEIIAIGITMVLGMSAVLSPDFVRLNPDGQTQKYQLQQQYS